MTGTAVFLTADPMGVPKALLHNLKHNRVLHERTVILSVLTVDEPFVEDNARLSVTDLSGGIYHAILSFCFSETPDVPWAFQRIEISGYDHNSMTTPFFIGHEAIQIGDKRGDLAIWRENRIVVLTRHRLSARIGAMRYIE